MIKNDTKLSMREGEGGKEREREREQQFTFEILCHILSDKLNVRFVTPDDDTKVRVEVEREQKNVFFWKKGGGMGMRIG